MKVSWVSLGWVICFKLWFLRLMFHPFRLRSVGWSCTVLNITLILQSDDSDPWAKLQDCFRYPRPEWRHKNISLFNYYEVSHVFSCCRYFWFVSIRSPELDRMCYWSRTIHAGHWHGGIIHRSIFSELWFKYQWHLRIFLGHFYSQAVLQHRVNSLISAGTQMSCVPAAVRCGCRVCSVC